MKDILEGIDKELMKSAVFLYAQFSFLAKNQIFEEQLKMGEEMSVIM